MNSVGIFWESGIYHLFHKRAMNPNNKLEVDELLKYDHHNYSILNLVQFVGAFTLSLMLNIISFVILLIELFLSLVKI